MGNVVQRIRSALSWQWGVATALIVLLGPLAGACSSAGSQAPMATAQGDSAATESADAFAMTTPPPVEIQSIELREGAPGIEMDVTASGAMVWTSYRNADGDLVVELPNSEPSTSLNTLTEVAGLVAKVMVEADTSGTRPITRLTISTRSDAEHALAAEGNVLRLSLVPTGTAMAATGGESAPAVESLEPPAQASASSGERFVYEPVRTEESASSGTLAMPETASLPMDLSDLGTADNPRHGPAPSGPLASTLRDVEVFANDTILVAGDGEFSYSTFRLENPERFVVDLVGVVNSADVATLPIESDRVVRVRVGQFKSVPQPVTRVVVDLTRPLRPVIEPTINGLRIKLGEPARVVEPAQVAQAEPADREPMAEPVVEPVVQEAVEVPAEATSEPVAAIAQAEPAQEVVSETVPAETEMVEETVAMEADPTYAEPTYAEPVVIVEDMAAPEIRADSPMELEPMAEPAMPAVATHTAQRLDEPIPIPVPVADTGYTVEPARGAPQLPASNDNELFASLPEEIQDGGAFTSRTFAARPIGQDEKVYTGDPISMTLRDADVVETLRSFANISDLSIVVQPEVKGSVTVELENVPWDQALEQILKINGLGYEIEGTIMRIAPLALLRKEAEDSAALAEARAKQLPLQTIIKRLSYSKAKDMASLLSGGGMISDVARIAVDLRTNSLIIKELPAYLDTVVAIMDEMDTPEPQVMIEARIIQTTKRFTRTLGVNWSIGGEASARFGNTTGLQFPNNVTGTGGVNLLTGAANGFLNLSLGNVLNSFNLDVALQAAQSEGLIKVLSAPKITTMNNEQAKIQSGLQIPIQTISNNTVTVQFINATLSLEVTPQVTAEGTVLLDISIQAREPQLAFTLAGSTNAPINTREAKTRVIVRDGGTTVIGGIYEVKSDQGEDKVPGLANIPLLGRLFKNRRRSDENKELLIFVTPRVVNL